MPRELRPALPVCRRLRASSLRCLDASSRSSREASGRASACRRTAAAPAGSFSSDRREPRVSSPRSSQPGCLESRSASRAASASRFRAV